MFMTVLFYLSVIETNHRSERRYKGEHPLIIKIFDEKNYLIRLTNKEKYVKILKNRIFNCGTERPIRFYNKPGAI